MNPVSFERIVRLYDSTFAKLEKNGENSGRTLEW